MRNKPHLRFQKRIRLFPGLRLNLSRSGIGLSAGVPGARVGIDATGRRYYSAGVPGTGLSVRQYGPAMRRASFQHVLWAAALVGLAVWILGR